MDIKPLILVTVGLVACSVDQPVQNLDLRRFVPDDASQVALSQSGRQLDYVLVRPLDAPSVRPEVLASYGKDGWRVCESGAWDTFTDANANGQRRVMQRVTYIYREQEIVGFAERYFEVNPKTDLDRRHVTLIAQTLDAPEIESIVRSNRLTCR